MSLRYIFRLLLIFIYYSVFSDLYAQQATIQITSEENSRGGYTFYAHNNTYTPFVVTINFSTLVNLNPGSPLPYSANVSPGRTRFLSLNKTLSGQQSRFQYSFRYHSGCLDTEHLETEYLLPYPEGVKARGGHLSYIGRWIEQETPEGWYSLVFYIDEPTTIHAARKGTVIAVRDGENSPNADLVYSSNRNFVTIVHDDCTFSRYSTFRDNEIFVSEGDKVNPGDPLGIASGEELGFGNQIRMLTYFRNDESVLFDRSEGEGIQPWRYIKPHFRTAEGEYVMIKPDEEYTSIHPEEIITSEMNRRERRSWSGNN
jgi:hypothetical protein